MKTTERSIANKFGKSQPTINLIKHGNRFTDDRELAMSISKLSGKAPIEHISPRFRDMYLRLYPELNEVPTNNGG